MSGRPAGRPPRISLEAVLAAGLEIGLVDLSIAAVAERLGVTRTSVHRHVGSRRDLETLVGEHLVETAPQPGDSGAPLEEHLLEFARGLVAHVRAHPGLAGYYARGFPRTRRSARVVEAFDATLVARGLSGPAAARLAAAVANHAIALAAFAMLDEQYVSDAPEFLLDPDEFPILADTRRAWDEAGPDAESWFDWSLRGAVRGLIQQTLHAPGYL